MKKMQLPTITLPRLSAPLERLQYKATRTIRSWSWRKQTLITAVPILAIASVANILLMQPTQASVNHVATAAGNNGTGSTSVTVNKPTGTAEGHVMLAVVGVRGGSGVTVSAPAGWTQINTNNSGTTLRSTTFYKVAGASEGSSYTFTWSGSNKASGVISTYSGVDTSSPINAQASQANSSSMAMTISGPLSTVESTVMVAMYSHAAGTSSLTDDCHGGMTIRGYSASTGSTANTRTTSAMQDSRQPTPGARSNCKMQTDIAAVNIGHMVVLAPATPPPIAHIGTAGGNNGGGSASITVNKPSGTAQNQVMIAIIGVRGGSGVTVTSPAGWTQLGTNNSTTDLRSSVFYKVSGASEGADYTFTLSTSQKAAGVISTYSGVDTSSPIDVHGVDVQPSSTIVFTGAVTTSIGRTRLVMLGSKARAATFSATDGMLRGQSASTGGIATSNVSVGIEDYPYEDTGYTGIQGIAAGGQSAATIGYNVALKPGSPAPPDPTLTQESYRWYNDTAKAPFSKLATPAALPGQNILSAAWSPDGQYLSVGSYTSDATRLTIYKRQGDTLVELPDPGTMPGGSVLSTAWSPDGQYLSVGSIGAPRLTIYKRDGDTFTKLADPGTMPSIAVHTTHWSSDGTYLAVGAGQSGTGDLLIYKRSGDTFTKLSNPPVMPSGSVNTVAWSLDGAYLSVGYNDSGSLLIYKRTGDAFAKVADPSNMPGTYVRTTAWSTDGQYLAVGAENPGRLTIYKRSGDTFTKLADPLGIPLSTIHSVAWSPDGKYLGVGNFNSPGLTIYERSGDTFTKTDHPVAKPGTFVTAIAWSPDSRYLTIGNNSTGDDRLHTYRVSRDTFAEIPKPDIMPSASEGVWETSWSPDGQYLAVGAYNNDANRFVIYKFLNGTLMKLPDPGTLPGEMVRSIAWSPNGNYVAVGSQTSGAGRFTIYKRSGDTFTKLADPSDMPTRYVAALGWSPDSTYLGVGGGAWLDSDFLVYKRSGDTFTKLSGVASPGDDHREISWTPDGTYMAVAFTWGGAVAIYKRDGDTFTRLPNPSEMPSPTMGIAVRWSSDGTYLAVGSTNFESDVGAVTLYKRDGDTLTKVDSPAAAADRGVKALSWSPDGRYLIVGHSQGVYGRADLYRREGDSLMKITDPDGVFGGVGVLAADWSPDGKYLAMGRYDAGINRLRVFHFDAHAAVGSPLAAKDTEATAPTAGTPFRLRLNLGVTDGPLESQPLKLRYYYAVSGACNPSASYSDVTTSSTLRYYNNSAVSHGIGVAPSGSDPIRSGKTPVYQMYSEQNPLGAGPTVAPGEDGIWDFALTFDGSTVTKTGAYCLKVTDGDDNDLNGGYGIIARILPPTSPPLENRMRHGQSVINGLKTPLNWQ